MSHLEEHDGYCPECGMSSIVQLVDEYGNIEDEYCAICGYAGIGIEVYDWSDYMVIEFLGILLIWYIIITTIF